MLPFEAGRSITFDSIFILELLHPHDRKTGLSLFQSTIQPKGAAQGTHTAHVTVSSTDRLVPDLWEVSKECTRHGLSPILHIETHGTKVGLGLEPDHPVAWDALIPPLRAINENSKMNLVVTLAACHGMAMVRALTPLEPSPVWGLFGPNEQVHEREVEDGYQKFYATLLDTLDVSAAVRALQTGGVWLPDAWHTRSAEFFLALVYGHFLDGRRQPGERIMAERRLVAKLRRRARKNRSLTLPTDVRSRIRRQLGEEELHFQRIRRRFLMLDRFPENGSRFPLSREDCLRVWKDQRAAYEAYDAPTKP
jgi:hypothetical protein